MKNRGKLGGKKDGEWSKNGWEKGKWRKIWKEKDEMASGGKLEERKKVKSSSGGKLEANRNGERGETKKGKNRNREKLEGLKKGGGEKWTETVEEKKVE